MFGGTSGSSTYRDVRRSFLDCVVIGFLRGDQVGMAVDERPCMMVCLSTVHSIFWSRLSISV